MIQPPEEGKVARRRIRIKSASLQVTNDEKGKNPDGFFFPDEVIPIFDLFYKNKKDPSTWNREQVATWLHWSQKQLNIGAESTDPSRYPSDGRHLCSWTVENFVEAAGKEAGPLLAASLFWLKRPHQLTNNNPALNGK